MEIIKGLIDGEIQDFTSKEIESFVNIGLVQPI